MQKNIRNAKAIQNDVAKHCSMSTQRTCMAKQTTVDHEIFAVLGVSHVMLKK